MDGEKAHNEMLAALEARGFCAVLKKGKTHTRESGFIRPFREMTNGSTLAWVDYIIEDVQKDTLRCAAELGFSELLAKSLLKKQRSAYEDLDTELGLRLPAISVEANKVHLRPLLILMNKNLIVTLHTSESRRFFRIRRYAESVLHRLNRPMPQIDRLTYFLARVLDENSTRNFDYLHYIEGQGDRLIRDLSDRNVSRDTIGHDIYRTKHALIVYLSGLWAVADTLNSLRYGDAELVSDEPRVLSSISMLASQVQVQIGLAEHLSEVLSSGLEVLQSIYNNQLQILNNRLAMLVAYLTIIGTAVLVPNTIATVMGNPMFQFGSQDIPWYLELILASTVLATIFSWWIVRKMDLLPERPQ